MKLLLVEDTPKLRAELQTSQEDERFTARISFASA